MTIEEDKLRLTSITRTNMYILVHSSCETNIIRKINAVDLLKGILLPLCCPKKLSKSFSPKSGK